MPIRDLFPLCPICGTAGSLRANGTADRCHACAARFRRARGAAIEARRADGTIITRTPREWLASMAAPSAPATNGRAVGPERARLRIAAHKQPLRRATELLGWIERFGPPREGTVRLDADGIHFDGDDGQKLFWPLDHLTAVQPSSTSLQIKARGQPVVALRFLEGSLRHWEDNIHEALRVRYRALGRGHIIEFQPRIVTR